MISRTLPCWLFLLLALGPAWAELSFRQVTLDGSYIAYERDVGDIAAQTMNGLSQRAVSPLCERSWVGSMDWYGSYLDRATFQWNVIGQSFMGTHICGNRARKNVTLHYNLYANRGSRTPLMQHASLFDFGNNVIYNRT